MFCDLWTGCRELNPVPQRPERCVLPMHHIPVSNLKLNKDARKHLKKYYFLKINCQYKLDFSRFYG